MWFKNSLTPKQCVDHAAFGNEAPSGRTVYDSCNECKCESISFSGNLLKRPISAAVEENILLFVNQENLLFLGTP